MLTSFFFSIQFLANQYARLKSTGVIDVENPVVKAYQEGKIQELSDNNDEKDDDNDDD
jgi:hypothetical protein